MGNNHFHAGVGINCLSIQKITTINLLGTYAHFTFDFLFASISQGAVDGIDGQTFFPLIVLGILAISYVYYHKLNPSKD